MAKPGTEKKRNSEAGQGMLCLGEAGQGNTGLSREHTATAPDSMDEPSYSQISSDGIAKIGTAVEQQGQVSTGSGEARRGTEQVSKAMQRHGKEMQFNAGAKMCYAKAWRRVEKRRNSNAWKVLATERHRRAGLALAMM